MCSIPCRIGTNKSALMSCSVNIRRRMEPPFPKDTVGNLLWKTVVPYECRSPAESEDSELLAVVSLLRKSFPEVNSSYVEKLKGEGGLEGISGWLDEVEKRYSDEGVEAYSLNSWCQMGFNEVDFGWGRAVWVSPGGSLNAPPTRGMLLVDAKRREEGEVEAWVRMEEERMEILMQEPEFLAFASPNPTISVCLN